MKKSNIELPSNIKFSKEERQFISDFSKRKRTTLTWTEMFDAHYTFSDFQERMYSFPHVVQVMKTCMKLVTKSTTRGSLNAALLSTKEHWSYQGPSHNRMCHPEVTKVFSSPEIIRNYLNSALFPHSPFLESAWKQLSANPAIDTGFTLVFQQDTAFRGCDLVKKKSIKRKSESIEERPIKRQKRESTQDIAICLKEYYDKLLTRGNRETIFSLIFNKDNLSVDYFKQSIYEASDPGNKLYECLQVFDKHKRPRARLFHAFLSPDGFDNPDIPCKHRPYDPRSLKVVNSIERSTLLALFDEKNKKGIEAHMNSGLVLDEDRRIVTETKVIQENINDLSTEIQNLDSQIMRNHVKKANLQEKSFDKQHTVTNNKRKNNPDSQSDVRRREIENSKPIDLPSVDLVRKHYIRNSKTNKFTLSGCDINFWKQLKSQIFSSVNPYGTFKACLDVVKVQSEKNQFIHAYLKPCEKFNSRERKKYTTALLDKQARDVLLGYEEDILRCFVEKGGRQYKTYFTQHMESTNIDESEDAELQKPEKALINSLEIESETSMESTEPQNSFYQETPHLLTHIDSVLLENDFSCMFDEFPWITEETTTHRSPPQDNSNIEIDEMGCNSQQPIYQSDTAPSESIEKKDYVDRYHSVSSNEKFQYHYGQNNYVFFAQRGDLPREEYLHREEKNPVISK